MTLGEPVPVPDLRAPVFIKIDVQPTVIGKLMSIIYKAPQLHLIATYADGRTTEYRYVAGMGQSGFILSPTISTAAEFLALQSPNWEDYLRGKMPVSIRIQGDSGTHFAWKTNASVQIYRLVIHTDANIDSMLSPRPVRIDSVQDFLPAPDGNIERVNDVDPGIKPLKSSSSLLHVSGWAMISAKDGTENQGVSIALVYPDGHALVYPADKSKRPDVGPHFHHPNAKMVGYDAVVNIRGLELPVDIRILQKSGDRTYISDRTVHLQ